MIDAVPLRLRLLGKSTWQNLAKQQNVRNLDTKSIASIETLLMMSMDRVYHLPNEQESLTTATNGTDGEVDDFSFG